MAQKINPIAFRLGTIQIWESLLQIYGKSFKQYALLLRKHLQLQKSLVRLLYNNTFLLDKQEYKIYREKIVISIYYIVLPNKKQIYEKNFFNKIIKIVEQWFSLKTIIKFYLKSESKCTINLISFYARKLFEQNIAPKKVLWNLGIFLESHINSQKMCYFKSGILTVKLKGYKIRLSGRLEGSKTQMAKSIEQVEGSLPLTSLKNYVEYRKEEIYTKSGICGIQIWLFYEIN